MGLAQGNPVSPEGQLYPNDPSQPHPQDIYTKIAESMGGRKEWASRVTIKTLIKQMQDG